MAQVVLQEKFYCETLNYGILYLFRKSENMLKIAILEDNTDQTKRLVEHLTKYGQENNVSFEISDFTNGLSFIQDFSPHWDIIFLDIEMPGLNGVEVAEEIRRVDKDVILIFVTNLFKYALKGYSVGAMDYLIKPVYYNDLSVTLSRVMNHFESTDTNYINLETKEGIHRINPNSLYYVEVNKHYLTYHTPDEDITVRGTMSSAEAALTDGFAKCNNCYLVNLKFVTEVTKESAQVGPHTLEISRRAYPGFIESLNNYLGRR